MLEQNILIPNGFLAIPASGEVKNISSHVATILSNLASFGYTLDRNALAALTSMPIDDLAAWWKKVQPALKTLTGADRKMEKHIVYRNFPKEVLDMDATDQIIHQILIYMGLPYDMLREPEVKRPPLGDMAKLKVLTLAGDGTESKIFADLVAMPNAWSDNQAIWASKLVGNRNAIVFSDFGFKVNAVILAAQNFERMEIEPSSGTDVIRLCAKLSACDPTLREKVKFKRFKRPDRRRLLTALDGQKNLRDDMAMRPEMWKRLMERLRPGDYGFENVQLAYDDLYNKRIKSFAAKVDPQMPTRDVLVVAATRPGEFRRRFHFYYGLFGLEAVTAFLPVMEKLTTKQLVSFRAYLRTIGTRKFLIYPPKSNWARAKVFPNQKTPIEPTHRLLIEQRISAILAVRLARSFPEGVALDDLNTDRIKLQTNDQKLAEYGRGTSFPIPKGITFIRSASYWQQPTRGGVTWFDNGWNFFDENWKPKSAGRSRWGSGDTGVAWNNQHYGDGAAIMSGDPVNLRDLKGRGCQMIDLYLDKLGAAGVRYGVWNILCYSGIKFSEADEVLGTLQMGEDAETGRVYEPSRAQMVFPIKAPALTSYIAMVDLRKREIVYLDAALKGNTSSALANANTLEKIMPAYVEYLEALPTVLELMQDAPTGTMPVLYSDANTTITEGRAFVFRPENKANTFERVSVTDLTTTE